jgi:isoleucyl-tRNA synthetase
MFQVERPAGTMAATDDLTAGRDTRRFLRALMATFVTGLDAQGKDITEAWPMNSESTTSRLIVLLALLAPLPCSLADEVYKSVDAEGHVVYSDRAPTAKAQKTVVHVTEGNSAEAARAAKETSILQTEDALRKRREATENHQKAYLEHEKQALCQRARDHYNSIKDTGRLYKLDAQGNRVYYTDAEADARREQWRQTMVTACGS